ncbi:MAG TPA: glycosyltransferase family 2 protein [Mycobacteriales bacterium]|nr:glycosyltransferase family 2 protein [Mycobacteriales bacterium]
MTSVLSGLALSWPVHLLLAFIALYPMVTAVVWVVTARIYATHREVQDSATFYDIADDDLPFVTVLVPAYREEVHLDATLRALHHLDYPRYEVLVVDDGSPDRTADVARRHVAANGRFRLMVKTVNEGKAMAMNDAMPLVRGSVLVVVDADARLHRDALRPIVAHFVRLPRVGAVTGNPRVANRNTLLSELQTLEFTSIVSLLRRAQVVWGRILTVSGVISAFRVSALCDVGMFDPSMATEDIDVSWRLQRRFYDIRYEPRALVDMTVPATTRALWRQRRRWALGLVQVLRRHRRVAITWKSRRQWPVFIEALLSIVWAHAFLFMLTFWVVCAAAGVRPPGASPFPNTWGMLVGTACLVQLAVGVRLDRRYDSSVTSSYWLAPLYPLGYWLIMSIVTVATTLPALVTRQPSLARWSSTREPSQTLPVVPADGRAATRAA